MKSLIAAALLAATGLVGIAIAEDDALGQLQDVEQNSSIATEAGQSDESAKEWSNRGFDRDEAPEGMTTDENLQPAPLSVESNSDESGSEE